VRVEWLGETAHTAEELLVQPASAKDTTELDQAKTAILDLLADGPVAADEAVRQLKQLGIARRTWERAKIALHVLSRKEGFSDGWCWCPPEDRHPHAWRPSASPGAGVPEKPLRDAEERQDRQERQPDEPASSGGLRLACVTCGSLECHGCDPPVVPAPSRRRTVILDD
jgi:hypothetical protein